MAEIPWGLYAGAGKSIAAGIEGAVNEYKDRERKRVLADLLGNQDLSTTDGALAASKALLQKGMTKEGMTLAQLAMGNRREMRQQANVDRAFQFQRENAAAGRSIQQQALELQRQAAMRREAPAGFRMGANGTMEPIPGGPADPAYKRAVGDIKPPRPLSEGAIKQLRETGTTLSDADRFGSTFDDKYAGWRNPTLGNLANTVARNTGLGNEQAAGWWQDYDRYKNQVRNKLFGSALTVREAAAFERADINPGMTPQAVRKNLAMQKQAAEAAAKKVAGVYAAQGRSPEEIEAAVGIPLERLGIKPKERGAARAAAASPANAPVSSGARVLGPATAGATEGRTGTYQGVRFIIRNGQMVTLQ